MFLLDFGVTSTTYSAGSRHGAALRLEDVKMGNFSSSSPFAHFGLFCGVFTGHCIIFLCL